MFFEVRKEINALVGAEVFIKREIKTHKKLIAAFKILAVLVTTTFPGGFAMAASLYSAGDLLSSSVVDHASSHSIKFTNGRALNAGDVITVSLAPEFSTITDAGDVSCPVGAVASYSGRNGQCLVGSAIATGTEIAVNIRNIINPSTIGSYLIQLTTTQDEHADVLVAITNNVGISASVASVLEFKIDPVIKGSVVNGSMVSSTSASTTLAFGSLSIGTSTTLAQQLSVITNATFGYNVTVQQDQDLSSNSGARISPFKDGTSTFDFWSAPTGDLSASSTYGHFGFTTDDDSLSDVLNSSPFSGGKFSGFSSTSPVEIMYNSGPADGLTPAKGLTNVAYRIQISPFQEAGDYYNILTYIATPTY